jgi:PGF-CTERM protein/surface glycoprotein (TIGR04207 family)
MTRSNSRIRAVLLAALITVSVVAGSVAFAGSTTAVSGTSAVSGEAFSPDTVDEETTNTHSFNYSFTGVNTSGDITLSISVDPELTVESADVELKNASGAVLDTNTTAGSTVSVTTASPASTVYLSGTVEVSAPSVDSDTGRLIKINATDNDGTTASTTETLTIENRPLTADNVSTFSPNTVDEETTNQHSFNYSFKHVSVNNDITFSLSGPSGSTITDTSLAVKNASGATLNTTPDVSGNSLSIVADSGTSTAYLAGTVNLTSPEVPSDKESETYDITAKADDTVGDDSVTNPLTVEYVGSGESGAPQLESAIQYKDGSTPTVEVAFSEDVQNFASNYDLYVEGEGELTGEIQSVSEARGRAVITLDESYSSKMTLQLSNGITDIDGNALDSDDTGNTSVRFAPTSVKASETATAYRGANVSVVASASDTSVQIEGTEDATDDYFFDGSTGTNSRVFVFATADRNSGDYEADIGSEGTADITVRGLGLSLDIDDRNVTNLQNIEGTVSARAGDRPVRLELLDDDGEQVEEVSDRNVELSGQGEYEFSYNLSSLDLDTGEYTIRATDTTSGVTVESDTIVVRDAGDIEATFTDGDLSETRGDVAAIPIELDNTREARLVVGSDNLGFEAEVTVRDDDKDGRVTVYFNSYAASTVSEGTFDGENDLFSVGDDDEVVDGEVTIGVSNLLDAESYDLSVYAEGRETDIRLLTLERRETTAIRTWTAPQDRYGDLDAAADVQEGNGEWLTRTDEVAVGDTVVYEIQASGLEGALDARGEDTVTAEFFEFANGSGSNPAARFTVEQEDPGPNQEPLLLQLNSSNSKVVADSANDSYYVVTRTGENAPGAVEDDDGDGVIDAGENDYGTISDDDDLRVEFTVLGDDENDLDLTTDGEDETVETSHSLVEAELSMSEPFNVTEVSGQEIFGEATVAPGTELTIRVRSGDNVRPAFLKTAETTVDANGQFLSTFSFNDTSPGDRYTIVVNSAGPAPELTVEGTVQPVIATQTTGTPEETTVSTSTSTPSTTSAAETTPTDSTAATTTTEIPTVQTSTTTPGFGLVAALVALAAAALLAVRRG